MPRTHLIIARGRDRGDWVRERGADDDIGSFPMRRRRRRYRTQSPGPSGLRPGAASAALRRLQISTYSRAAAPCIHPLLATTRFTGNDEIGSRLAPALQRLTDWDAAACLRANRLSRRPWPRRLLRAASRLGDGVFWYALMLSLAFAGGERGPAAAAQLALTGLACTAPYKWLKGRTARPRPYAVRPEIVCAAAPLDRFSFPSGHTLHAVGFTVVALAHYPALAPLLVPFTLLVAMSRPVLGLHYPSDVLAGAAIGALVGYLSLRIAPV